MEHLLDGDPAHHRAPPVDGVGLIGSQAIARAVLEAELCEQVLAHDHVLESQRLREKNPQVLAVPDDNLGLDCSRRSSRRLREWPWREPLASVPRRKALPDMAREFQFIDHRDGEILNRDPALADSVYQQLIGSEAELSRTLPARQVRPRDQVGRFKFRLFPQLVQSMIVARAPGFTQSGISALSI